MRVLVMSIALGNFKSIFRSCLSTHRAYCKRHGYQYRVVDSLPVRLTPSDSSWLKIPLLIHAMEEGWDWVAFVDADCEIRASCPPLEEVATPGKSVFMAQGFSGRYNAGVIIARKGPEALGLLRAVWENAERGVPEEDRAPYENGHVIHYAKSNPAVGLLGRTWNNNVEIDPSSYIQHYSAGRLRKTYMERRAVKARRIIASLRKRLARRVRGGGQGVPQCVPIHDRLLPAIRYCAEKLVLPAP